MSALAVVLRYRNLLAVEQSFLAAKTLLATRPIFHRTDAAIRGHIFCTFLALVLRTELLERLAASGGAVPEWRYIIDDLLDLSAVEVDQDGRRALLRTAPRPSINPICRALGLTLPPIFQEVPTETASIPRSGQNPKILGRDDTEVIRYLITIGVPFPGHFLAQEREDRRFEIGECRMTSIVGDMLVHQPP